MPNDTPEKSTDLKIDANVKVPDGAHSEVEAKNSREYPLDFTKALEPPNLVKAAKGAYDALNKAFSLDDAVKQIAEAAKPQSLPTVAKGAYDALNKAFGSEDTAKQQPLPDVAKKKAE